MISVTKILYKGEQRIRLSFKWDEIILKKIKTLPGRKWSSELTSWHIPYTKKSFASFLNLDLKHQIEKSGTTEVVSTHSESPSTSTLISPQEDRKVDVGIHQKKDGVSIRFQHTVFFVFLNYNEAKVNFIKSLKGAYWSPKNKCWIIKASIESLNSIQSFFNIWSSDQFLLLEELIKKVTSPCKVEIYRIPEYPKEVCVKVSGYGIDISVIKKVTGRSYDKQFRRWRIPNDSRIVDRIKAYYLSKQVVVRDRLPKSGASYTTEKNSLGDFQKRLISKLHPETSKFISEYTDVLIAQRYSRQTIKQYSAAMIKYFEYIGRKGVAQHTVADVNNYLAQISKKKISESYINGSYSAIKLYYEKVAYLPNFQFDRIKRPRKGKYLPTILSTAEVNRLLTSCTNLKHATLLYTLYSSGMRLSEILNVRLEDIWWDRNQILIKGGKGKKDRVVMLSRVLKEILSLYVDEYKPIYWMFEGRDQKTKYTSSSVQKVVRASAIKAGIHKRVTPHTIRHCFATHLMDGGTDVRFIQELLGHKDIKTTLIYTHVTTSQIDKIDSPLDRLRGVDSQKVE